MEETLVIDVARLDPEGEDFEGVLDDAVLDLNDPYVKPFAGIRYEINAQVFGTELLVRGTLEQDFDGVCSRCGKDFDFTVSVPDFTASFEVPADGSPVDLTDEVRQSIILALPTYPRCRPDCPGLQKETDSTPDDRWSVLDNLTTKE